MEFINFLEKSIAAIPKDEIALAFSGGVDSSLLAALLKSWKIRAYVVGIKNSADIIQAEKAAKQIKIKLEKIIVSEKEIELAIPIVRKILGKPTNSEIAFNLPWYFVCKNAREKIIINGNGPDELLGGYHKYKKMNSIQVEKEMARDIKKLIERDGPRQEEIAKHFKKLMILPYLDKDIVGFCKSLPLNMKINGENKYILRKSAEKLLGRLAWKEKKACHYGSGIMNVIIKLDRKDLIN